MSNNITELSSESVQSNLEEAKRIVSLLNNSYKDYLSARVLYNNELLVPATILANTALEKNTSKHIWKLEV